MKRDYKKEYEKEKETKVIKTIKLDKKLYNSLKLKLNNQNKTFTSLVNDCINNYLGCSKMNEEEKKVINYLENEYKKLEEKGNILFPLYKHQAFILFSYFNERYNIK